MSQEGHPDQNGTNEHAFAAAEELKAALGENGRAEQHEATPSGFDERQQGVLNGAHFFEPYKKDLHELFVALDREDKWSDDPAQMLEYMRAGWIGGEHGNSADKDQFTPEQIASAAPIIDRLGLLNELLPPDGTNYDDVLIVGGTTAANYRRVKLIMDLMQNHGITADKVTLMLGQRPREERDGKNNELLGQDGRFAGGDVSENPWLKKMMEAEEESWFADETATGRLATMKAIPGAEIMSPHRIDLEVTDVTGLSPDDAHRALPKHVGPLPPRLMTDYHFEVPVEIGGKKTSQEIVLLNAAAVIRDQGDPRHTTASGTAEWLNRDAPPKSDKSSPRVLYITGNPHTLRTAQDTVKIMREADRGDIHLDVAGTSAPAGAPVQFALGEVARLIDNDVKRNYPKQKNPQVEK